MGKIYGLSATGYQLHELLDLFIIKTNGAPIIKLLEFS